MAHLEHSEIDGPGRPRWWMVRSRVTGEYASHQITNGPADGVTLILTRSPLIMRVMVDLGGELSALDQVTDVPREGERPYAYLRKTKPTFGFVTMQKPGGGRGSVSYSGATYHLIELQPERAVMMDNARWQEWCRAQAEAMQAGGGK